MSIVKSLYPVSTTVPIACSIALLPSDAGLLIGWTSAAIDNTTNLDLSHHISGTIRAGATAPTVGTTIEIWAYAAIKMAASAPTFPDGILGADAASTRTSLNAKFSGLTFLKAITVDAIAARDYSFGPIDIAARYDGFMPQQYGLFIVQNTGQTLNATQVALQYDRKQTQVI